MMKKRILSSVAMAVLVFVSLNSVAFAASPPIGGGTVEPQDEPIYMFYTFTQTVGERTVDPTSWTFAGRVYNQGETVTVGTMNVPLSFNVSVSAGYNLLSGSFGLTPSSTSVCTAVTSSGCPANTTMTIYYGFESLQHRGYITEYINGVAYRTYQNQWVNKATNTRLRYSYN